MKNYVAGHVSIITIIMRRNISAPTITRSCNFLDRSLLDSIFTTILILLIINM